MGDRLAGVPEGPRADLPRPPHQRRDGVDGAEEVRLVGEGQNPTSLVDQLIEVLEVQAPVGGDVQPAQFRPGTPAQVLPGQQVGVVLHLGHHDAIAGAEGQRPVLALAAPGVREGPGDHVDRLRGVLGEHHLVGVGPDEGRDPGPGGVEQRGRLAGQLVVAPVHVGVVQQVEVALGIQDLQRLVGGGGVVQVDQRATVDTATEDREVAAHGRHVEDTAADGGGQGGGERAVGRAGAVGGFGRGRHGAPLSDGVRTHTRSLRTEFARRPAPPRACDMAHGSR